MAGVTTPSVFRYSAVTALSHDLRSRLRPSPRISSPKRQRQSTQHLSRNKTTWTLRADPDASTRNEAESAEEESVYAPPDNEPTVVGKFFGSYLQLGVWIVVLSFAGYKGIQQAQTDPSSVGLLLAPPAGALFLIITFLIYRFGSNKEDTDEA